MLASDAAAQAFGTPWFARVWRTDDGLPDNAISGVAQTPDGFLWVGTQGGLMRFDGTRFQEFSPINLKDIPNRVVRALTVDRTGRLWLGMDRGIVLCAEPGKVRLFTHKDGLPDGLPKVMTEDGEGAIWIAYTANDGISRIKDGKVTRFDMKDGLPAGGYWCWLTTDTNGELWWAKGNHVGIFRDGRFQKLLTLDDRVEDRSARITKARAGGIWICTETRIWKYKLGGQLEERGRLPHAVGPGILYEDRTGALWIGSWLAYGLFRYDGSEFETVPTSHPVVTSLLEDQEGNMWVGTAGGGLNRLRPQVLELIDAGSGRPSDSVRSICEDAAGTTWAVTRDGLLTHRVGTNWVNLIEHPQWPGGRASCVTAGAGGELWIGTRGAGLYCFHENQFKVWKINEGLASDTIRSLMVSSTGDLWIGTDAPRQLQRLRDGRFRTFPMPSETRSIRAMAEDAAGNMWTGTAEGQLLRIRGDELLNVTTNQLPQVISIRCLHATPDGGLWIGHADGLGMARLKNGKYVRLTTEQGLSENYVSQIVADEQGWLWLAGNRGLSRVQLQQLNDVADGRAPRVRAIVFGRGEGLPGLQAAYDNYPAAFRGRDGRPRLATRTGLAIIHTENIRDNPDQPPVLMERFAVDGLTWGLYDSRSPLRVPELRSAEDLRNPATGLRLPPDHRKIEFEFTALSLTAPENVQFRYQLEGFDEKWIDGGTANFAIYSRLPARDYRFRVIACNNSGVWNETGASMTFAVLPFFWETWWFRVAALTAFTLFIIAIVRYVSFRRLRWQLRVLEQQATLDKERTRIARDLHDDLGGSLTQVALLLDMAGEDSAAGKLNGNLQQCSSMVRQVVKSVDGIIWAINPRNDTLRYLIDYTTQFGVEFLQAANIRCRVEMPDDISERSVSPEVRHHLFLVIKEALNNIVCHAHATEVRLRVDASDDQVGITIEDNGRGFEHAPNNSRANGLRNMRQRMEEIGGRFTVDSKPGQGTSVSFVYSWRQKKMKA